MLVSRHGGTPGQESAPTFTISNTLEAVCARHVRPARHMAQRPRRVSGLVVCKGGELLTVALSLQCNHAFVRDACPSA